MLGSMKIRTKILLLFTLGAGVPLLLSHFFVERMLAASLEERIFAGQIGRASCRERVLRLV